MLLNGKVKKIVEKPNINLMILNSLSHLNLNKIFKQIKV